MHLALNLISSFGLLKVFPLKSRGHHRHLHHQLQLSRWLHHAVHIGPRDIRSQSEYRNLWQKVDHKILCYLGREPWSSGYGRRLMFQRSWVQTLAPYTGWTFFTFICFQDCIVCLKIAKHYISNYMKTDSGNKAHRMGSGCGSVGRAVSCDTRGPRFASCHRQHLLNICLLSTVLKRRK